MKIVQLVHTLQYGDAISQEALTIHRLLVGKGVNSEIVCVNLHEKLVGRARKLEVANQGCSDWKQADEPIVLVLHFSIASVLNEIFLDSTSCKRVVIYHNLTPVHWFEGYNARVAGDLRDGHQELKRVIEGADVVLADSSFNAGELVQMGRSDAQVFPLVLDEDKWRIEANAGISAMLRARQGANILHVGRIAPNKCLEDILKVFYFYHHKIDQMSHLWLVGHDVDTEIYSFELRCMIDQMRLKNAVTFVGSIADCELKAFYQNSSSYICMSEHEGFCVPLIEAMYFGLPVVAYGSSAIGETLGDAGLIVNEKVHAQIAELVSIACAQGEVREELITQGRQRVESFGLSEFARKLDEVILKPLSIHA